MREILFRGKRKDNGEWVEGYYFYAPIRKNEPPKLDDFISKHWIITPDGNIYEVIPETVGQYTGLTTNGKKIFEGDIVVVNIKGYNTICKVAWADTVAQFQLWQTNTIPNTPTSLNLGNYDCEVIGNIHDNPELLKGGVDNG